MINELGNIIHQSNGLAYNARNLDQVFKQHFPGYVAPQDYDSQYQKITETTLNTLNGVLKTSGKTAEEFQDENARLAFLQTQEKNAKGQTQALQAAAQIASEQVSQLQLLRQTIMAQTNSQIAYFADQIQKKASGRAEFSKIIRAENRDTPAIGQSGQTISMPDFKD